MPSFNQLSKSVLFALTLLVSVGLHAAPVTVLLKPSQQVASDLEEDGRLLTEEEVLQKRETGFDLSLLNPDQSTDYWKEEAIGSQVKEDQLIDAHSSPLLTFQNTVSSEIGTTRVRVLDENGKQFVLQFSRNNHKMLLWKALLEKLGYKSPAMQWLPEAKLKINNSLIDDFKKGLAGWTGEPKSWIREQSKNELSLQDVLLFEATPQQYPIATGFIRGAVMKTRLFNALPIAYSMLTYPDAGLDQMSWTFGSVSQGLLLLDFQQNISGFSPKYEDARWIARLILNLSKKDWEEIIAASQFPHDIQTYLLQKVLSRRNNLAQVLNLEASELSFKKDLKIQKKLEGFADTFKSEGMSAPLSSKQLIPYGEALLQSTVIDAAIGKFNSSLMPSTDIEKQIQNKTLKSFTKQIQDFMDTGVEKNIPFGVYAFPYLDAQLIMSRDVVTGTFMGSKNLVQMADSFGFSVLAGTFVGFNGLPQNVFAHAQGQLYFTRVYTHIKPLKEIQSVFKEPYKNIFVEATRRALINKFSSVIDKISKNEELQKSDLVRLKQDIDLAFPEGDSLVITDSLGSSIAGTIGLGFHSSSSLSASASASGRMIKRMHILRTGGNKIQIYLNDANVSNYSISVDLNSYIPVMSVTRSAVSAGVNVDLFELDLNPEQDPKKAVSEFKSFHEVLKHVRLRSDLSLPKIQSMNLVKSKEKSFSAFGFKIGSQNVNYNLRIETPKMGSRTFIKNRRSNYEDWDKLKLTQQVANAAIDRFITQDFNLNFQGSPTAGENFLGMSSIFDANFEAVVDDEGLSQLFYTSSRMHKKWKISKKDMLKKISGLNRQAGTRVFDEAIFTDVTSMQFYTLKYQTIFYEKAILKLLTLTDAELSAVIARKEFSAQTRSDEEVKRLVSLVRNDLKKYQRGMNKTTKHLTSALIRLDKALTFTGLQALMGRSHVLLLPSVSGFKTGESSGYETIRGTVIGKIPSDAKYGPISNVSTNASFLESELLSSWLVRGFQ